MTKHPGKSPGARIRCDNKLLPKLLCDNEITIEIINVFSDCNHMCNYVCLPSAEYQPDFVLTDKKCLGTPLNFIVFNKRFKYFYRKEKEIVNTYRTRFQKFFRNWLPRFPCSFPLPMSEEH